MNNKKKVFVVIAVLLVALISASSIIYASQEADENAKSDLTAAQSTNETQQEDAEAEEKVRYMFVQSAHSGSFVPVEGEENLYTLALEGVSPQTIAFSDRPERVVGQVPMQKFLDGLGFSPKNPANAALEILEGNESQDVMVVELFDPVYDAVNKTLQYNVSIQEMPNHSYAVFNERHDESLSEHFGPAALFIDDCSAGYVNCRKVDWPHEFCGDIDNVGCCWVWTSMACEACNDYTDECKRKYGNDCSYVTENCGW